MPKLFGASVCVLALLFVVSEALHASVQYKDHYCVMFNGDINGSITYKNKNKETSVYNFELDEATVNLSGSCSALHKGKSANTLSISFLPVNSSESMQWLLKIVFVSKKDHSFEIGDATLVAYPPERNELNMSKTYVMKDAGDNWFVEDDGYACSSSKVEFYNQSFVEFHNLRVLAFAKLVEDKFPTGQVFNECALDSKTSEIVPIIVGACLAGLVIIVLVAYLIGRARARRQGYASV